MTKLQTFTGIEFGNYRIVENLNFINSTKGVERDNKIKGRFTVVGCTGGYTYSILYLLSKTKISVSYARTSGTDINLFYIVVQESSVTLLLVTRGLVLEFSSISFTARYQPHSHPSISQKNG
jgi:hypothetical protein